MTPEQRAHYDRATRTMPAPDWSSAWTELHGYLSEAAADARALDVAEVLTFMAELKDHYVTAPVRAWIKAQPKR